MQLHAVIVPPPDVVQAALAAAREMLAPVPAAVDTAKPGLLDRLRGRGRTDAPTAPAVTLVPARLDAVFVNLAKFGNVVTDDARALREGIEVLARTWPAPVLHVSAVRVAAAPPFDVTAQLDGQIDALQDIFRNVNDVAQSQRFFLDRRSYRNELVLGSVGVEGDAPLPDEVAGAETPHAGPRWSPSHITLMRTSFVNGATTFAEFARIPLATPADGLNDPT